MKLARECALLLLLAAIPALLSLWLNPKRPALAWTKLEVIEIDLSETARESAPILWVDARDAEAYERQHIPGAILLNENSWELQLPNFLTAWYPGTRIVVYCDSQACDASQTVALRIQHELNLPDVYVLKGGWSVWLKASH